MAAEEFIWTRGVETALVSGGLGTMEEIRYQHSIYLHRSISETVTFQVVFLMMVNSHQIRPVAYDTTNIKTLSITLSIARRIWNLFYT